RAAARSPSGLQAGRGSQFTRLLCVLEIGPIGPISSMSRSEFPALALPARLERQIERRDDFQQEAGPEAGSVRIAQDEVVLGAPVSAPPEGQIASRVPRLVDDPAADRPVPA